MIQLGQIGAAPGDLIDMLGYVAVEVTIGAFGLAKGPMDIDTKGGFRLGQLAKISNIWRGTVFPMPA